MIASRGTSLRYQRIMCRQVRPCTSPVRRLLPASAKGLGHEKTPGGTTTIERACLILSDLREDAHSAGLGQFLEQITNEAAANKK
jgi:hypothetical protein